MSYKERRITHITARKLDLRSVSSGKDPERYTTIKRSRMRGGLFSCMSMNETQSLYLLPEQKQKIQSFISQFPIEQQHLDDYFALSNNKSKNLFVTYIFNSKKWFYV